MDRKSRILIVSFFNYILVISHGKVGGKVGSVIKSLSPRVQKTIQVNGTQFNTSAKLLISSSSQNSRTPVISLGIPAYWLAHGLSLGFPLTSRSTAISTTARLTSASPLSLLTIAIMIPCLLGGVILESRRFSPRGIILGCLWWAVLRSCWSIASP